MICNVSSGIRLSMRARFHSLVSLVRISETIRSMSCCRTGPWNLSYAFGLIQESSQRLVVSPLPIVLPRCCMRRSRPWRMPLQPCEMADEAVIFRKDVLLQYFPKMIREKRQVGAMSSLQAIFARRA